LQRLSNSSFVTLAGAILALPNKSSASAFEATGILHSIRNRSIHDSRSPSFRVGAGHLSSIDHFASRAVRASLAPCPLVFQPSRRRPKFFVAENAGHIGKICEAARGCLNHPKTKRRRSSGKHTRTIAPQFPAAAARARKKRKNSGGDGATRKAPNALRASFSSRQAATGNHFAKSTDDFLLSSMHWHLISASPDERTDAAQRTRHKQFVGQP